MLAAHRVLHAPKSSGSAYDAAVLADTPSGYWPGKESSGTTAYDLSGNGNNGSYSGSYTLGATGIGDGETIVNFTGGQMAVPDTAPLRLGSGALSVEAWINPSSLASYATLFDNTSAGGRGYSAFINAGAGSTGVYVTLGDSANPGEMTISSGITTSNLYYFALTSSGSTLKIYLNASLVLNTSITAGPDNSNSGVTFFGNPSGGGGLLQGLGGKFAVYNYVLTSTQISNHYAAA